MSKKKQKTNLVRWGRDYVEPADHARLTQAKSNYDKLSLELQNKFFMSLADTANFYPDKKVWKPEETMRLRLVWNWMPTDWICDHFFCSHKSLIDHAIVNSLHPINDKQALSIEDLDSMKKWQESGMSIKEVAKVFGMEYNFNETKEIDEKTRGDIEMVEQSLFGDDL